MFHYSKAGFIREAIKEKMERDIIIYGVTRMFSRKVKILLIDKQLKQKELAEKLNTSRTNLTDKIRRDNFSEKDMQSIADALNCKLVIKLIDKETGQEY